MLGIGGRAGLTLLPSVLGNRQDEIDLATGRRHPEDELFGGSAPPPRGWWGAVWGVFWKSMVTAAGAAALGGLIWAATWTWGKALLAREAIYVQVPAHTKTLAEHGSWIAAQQQQQLQAPRSISESTAVQLLEELRAANPRRARKRTGG